LPSPLEYGTITLKSTCKNFVKMPEASPSLYFNSKTMAMGRTKPRNRKYAEHYWARP
jgi:hypothetical protein